MKTELSKNGFIHLTNQSQEQLQSVINSLGDVIMTTDVVVKTESKGMVTTALGLDYHTDHHKAKYILWYCYKQTDKGGESIIIDAEKVYSKLSLEFQEELKKINLFEHKVFPDDQEYYPLVALDEKGKKKFYYSFWLVKDEDRSNVALREFQKIIKETDATEIKLQEGDILIVDNHRVFHGRKAIEGSKNRFLKRYWIVESNKNL
ncbi:TauD/TfdA family dioxygenase [Flavobacterium sp.]|uniref:TauD/TfdA family dioxygenase n=1 Tax=Flavobacterium sp. TaxID=239 RepID=UPI002635F427|nr:TauD/TfdA family dioxygenase [Flavobacterium sp.]MDD2986139.1 TauD/TfdA family dioxygenase [Flavobacterium sp.]